MTNINTESDFSGQIETPNQVEPQPIKTNTTVGKSIAWLALFTVVFYGAVFIYAGFVGFQFGMDQAGLQSGLNSAEVSEQAGEHVMQQLLEPSGIFAVGLIQFVLLVPLVVLVANYPARKWQVSLAFNKVAAKTLGIWFGVYFVYLALQTGIDLIAKPEPAEVFGQVAGSHHLGMFIYMVVFAPILEELVFRGYLFNAWRNTRLGASGTILLTTVLFALLHVAQYSWLLVGYITVFSIILGVAREKTNSIVTPMVIHSLNNLIAATALIYLGIQ